MSDDHTSWLQQLLDRSNQGDDSARKELVGCACERLRFLAKRMLHHRFPWLENAHRTDSVLHEVVIRILEALEEIKPTTMSHFWAVTAQMMHWMLVDWTRKHRPLLPLDDLADGLPDDAHDPPELAAWREFHQKVEELPENEREVFELIGYEGLSQAEAARRLALPAYTVKYRWNKARLRLADLVQGFGYFLREEA
jgi:RNA polymerase sigma-70 factor (ECF subfamily)